MGLGWVGARDLEKRVTAIWVAFLNLSLLYLLLSMSFNNKGLSHRCDSAGQGPRQRVPNIVFCPFSPMASWFKIGRAHV